MLVKYMSNDMGNLLPGQLNFIMTDSKKKVGPWIEYFSDVVHGKCNVRLTFLFLTVMTFIYLLFNGYLLGGY